MQRRAVVDMHVASVRDSSFSQTQLNAHKIMLLPKHDDSVIYLTIGISHIWYIKGILSKENDLFTETILLSLVVRFFRQRLLLR